MARKLVRRTMECGDLYVPQDKRADAVATRVGQPLGDYYAELRAKRKAQRAAEQAAPSPVPSPTPDAPARPPDSTGANMRRTFCAPSDRAAPATPYRPPTGALVSLEDAVAAAAAANRRAGVNQRRRKR